MQIRSNLLKKSLIENFIFLQWQHLALFCETKKHLKSPQVFLQLQLVMAKGETKNTQITTTHQKLDSCSF